MPWSGALLDDVQAVCIIYRPYCRDLEIRECYVRRLLIEKIIQTAVSLQ